MWVCHIGLKSPLPFSPWSQARLVEKEKKAADKLTVQHVAFEIVDLLFSVETFHTLPMLGFKWF